MLKDPVQLVLYDDVRVPDAFIRSFEVTGRCDFCKQPLTCHVHAQRHWSKCHTKKVRTATKRKQPLMYFVWKGNVCRWKRVDRETWLVCNRDGFSCAWTRGVDLEKVVMPPAWAPSPHPAATAAAFALN